LRQPFDRCLGRVYVWVNILLALLLYWLGGWPFVVWGVFVRLVLTYHCTFLVNSASHTFGYKSFPTHDLSTNCWWVALLSYGEGWHNNHHAFQRSARHGHRWWEFDVTWLTIRVLEKIGLVLINVNITDITDESGYIEAIGKRAAAEAINRAKVEVAQQERDGATGQATADRERDVGVADRERRARGRRSRRRSGGPEPDRGRRHSDRRSAARIARGLRPRRKWDRDGSAERRGASASARATRRTPGPGRRDDPARTVGCRGIEWRYRNRLEGDRCSNASANRWRRRPTRRKHRR
ncbi:MAG: fatty acid desaturase, partial [Myxococcales bacterium]|nr:fatty acid desaturase [Myxococcales bacterium]